MKLSKSIYLLIFCPENLRYKGYSTQSLYVILESISIRNVIKRKAKRGEISKASKGGIIPRKRRKYGSVIFPRELNGC